MKLQFKIIEVDARGVRHVTECPTFEIADVRESELKKLHDFETFINERSNVRLHVEQVGP